jgi:uncharacterized iron-regulated membrane protein
MSSRIPQKPSEHEAEGVPDPGFADLNQLESGDPQGTTEPPHDTAVAADEFGTTAREQHDGEPLTGRLEREEPDVLAQVDAPADESAQADTPFNEGSGQRVGRLVEPDEGARTDTEKDLVAGDVGTDLGGYSAEEAAMHLEPEA